MAEFHGDHISPPPSEGGNSAGKAKILDFVQVPNDPNAVRFHIGHDVKGDDVLATLRYLSGAGEAQNTVEGLLKHGVERGLLNNMQVKVDDPVDKVSDQARIVRQLVLGDSPRLDDLKDALSAAYQYRTKDPEALQEIVNKKLQLILATLVDRGKYANTPVTATNRNELARADEQDIADEIEAMRREFSDEL